MTIIPDTKRQNIRRNNLMPYHTQPSLNCSLRPNQAFQIYQKQPSLQSLKNVHNIKYVHPEDIKSLFSNVTPMSCTQKYFYRTKF